MNSQQIASIIKMNGGKVLRQTEDQVIAQGQDGVQHTFMKNDVRITAMYLAEKIINVKKKAPPVARKTKKTPKSKGEGQTQQEFQDELEAVKGIGAASAKFVAKNYDKASLIKALKDGVDLKLNNIIVSTLKKEYL